MSNAAIEVDRYCDSASNSDRPKQVETGASREEEDCDFEIVNAVYVDSRKDATLTTIEISDSKFYSKAEIEEHLVIVGEPAGLYLTHFSVEDCKGVTVGKAIYKELENTNLQNSWSIVGSDGTAIMTGKHRGSNATMEQLL